MQLEKIPSEVELVIFDFYDTIIRTVYYNQNKLRNGIEELVEHLKQEQIPMVISSDGDEYGIERDFGYAIHEEFQKNFKKIYGRKHLLYDHEEKRLFKNLIQICVEQDVNPSKTVFIGDDFNGNDSFSAQHCNIDYIIVPKHLENPNFSFTNLVNYDSK
ncbi:MAG: HAD family hydrolase [Nanoarchaeota archaeon]